MTNQTINNASDSEFGRIILWQYDHAENLIALIKSVLSFYDNSTKYLWNKYETELSVDTSTDYGLAILGTLIGCPRPIYNGNAISSSLYRRFIKARYQLSRSNYSVEAINQYLKTVFNGAVTVVDNFDMTLSWTVNRNALTAEELYCIDSLKDYTFPFPAAVHDNTTFAQVLFAVVDSQPADPTSVTVNGISVGCLDDSTFYDDHDDSSYIPEEERISQ